MEYITDNKATSGFAKRLDDAVEAIKNGEGWRIEYMQLKEKLDKQYSAGHSAGVEQGLKRGIKQGIEQGIEQGVAQAEKATVLNMLKKGKYSREEIAECTGVDMSVICELEKELD